MFFDTPAPFHSLTFISTSHSHYLRTRVLAWFSTRLRLPAQGRPLSLVSFHLISLFHNSQYLTFPAINILVQPSIFSLLFLALNINNDILPHPCVRALFLVPVFDAAQRYVFDYMLVLWVRCCPACLTLDTARSRVQVLLCAVRTRACSSLFPHQAV
ncbi:hypothetical protein C8R44DRAFT_896503 [Mycena epipterygia]|nr:hypothetical protein C8R44DRAFT_896503 [Mycena epipterygia]